MVSHRISVRGRRDLALGTILACFAALALLAPPASAAFPGDNGLIAYTHIVGDGERMHGEIAVVNGDGSGRATLARGGQPAWSPDGKRLAFVRLVDGELQIFTMAADGSRVRQVTRFRRGAEQPAWSPDGRFLIFARYSDAMLATSIWRMRPDRSGLRRVVPAYDSKGRRTDAWEPAWGVDGRIAYSARAYSDGKAATAIFSIRPDGSGRRRLTQPSEAFEPDWSPDGGRLLYKRYNGTEFTTLHVMRADGSGKRLLPTEGWVHDPAWSPDGRFIVYMVYDSGTAGEPSAGLYRMHADGTGRRLLRAGAVSSPSWQPLP